MIDFCVTKTCCHLTQMCYSQDRERYVPGLLLSCQNLIDKNNNQPIVVNDVSFPNGSEFHMSQWADLIHVANGLFTQSSHMDITLNACFFFSFYAV